MYQKYLEPIIEDFTTGEYYREVYNAKQEYFDKAGIVYEIIHPTEKVVGEVIINFLSTISLGQRWLIRIVFAL